MSLASVSPSTSLSVVSSARLPTRTSDLSTVKSAVRALSKGVLLRAQGLSPGFSSGDASTLNAALTSVCGQFVSGQGIGGASSVQKLLTSYLRNATASSTSNASLGALVNASI